MSFFKKASELFTKLDAKAEHMKKYWAAIDKVLDMTPEQVEKLVKGENPFPS